MGYTYKDLEFDEVVAVGVALGVVRGVARGKALASFQRHTQWMREWGGQI